MNEQWWSWGQKFRHWKDVARVKPTKPGAAPGTTVADLAGGGPFWTENEAKLDAFAHGFGQQAVNVWADLADNWQEGTRPPGVAPSPPVGGKCVGDAYGSMARSAVIDPRGPVSGQ